MARIWFSSDHHFFHENMLKLFTIPCPACQEGTLLQGDGTKECGLCAGTSHIPARPFTTVSLMHDFMIQQHNAVVKPEDHWYALGDIAILRGNKVNQRMFIDLVQKFNGHKRLILGNHDKFPILTYLTAGFEKIKGSHRINNLLFTHFPVERGSVPRGCVNVHGHIHTNKAPAGPYLNISVEATNYAPVSLEWIEEKADSLVQGE